MTTFHPASSRSSYFPYSQDTAENQGHEEEDSALLHSRPLSSSPNRRISSPEEADSLSLAILSHGIQFPQHDGVLWDRTGLTAPRYCLADRDVLPALILTRQDLLYLLQTLALPANSNSNSSSSVVAAISAMSAECVGSVFASSELPSAHRQVLACFPTTSNSSNGSHTAGSIGGASFGFVLNQANNKQAGLDMSFTIPLTRRQFASNSQVLQFDPQSYSSLRQNLWKSLRSSRSFAFRHFVRMRAIGYANSMETPSLHKKKPSSSSPSKHNRNVWHKGIARFEVLLPEMSFQFVGIPAIPILATPLCLNLLSAGSSNSNNNQTGMFSTSDSLPGVGYVTLNQTRKVVFMLENDHNAIARTPLVGVWLRLPQSSLASSSGSSATDHPMVWAACVRYMLSERIAQRVFIATDTFLLVLIMGEMVQYFEVTMLPVKKGETEEELVSFLTLDFTADLSVESDNEHHGSDTFESLVCKFKATNQYNLRNPPPSAAATSSRSIKLPPQSPYSEDSSSMLSNPPLPRSLPPSIASKFTPSSATHPLLVSSSNESSPSSSYYESAPACYSSLLTAQKFEQQVLRTSTSSSQQHSPHQQQENSSVQSNPALIIPAHRHGISLSDEVNNHAQYAYSFPAEIIASQQRQLAMLQQQVEDLRQLVLTLGGRLPTNEASNEAATTTSLSHQTNNSASIAAVAASTHNAASRPEEENSMRNQSISSKGSDLLSFSSLPPLAGNAAKEQMSTCFMGQESLLLEVLANKPAVLTQEEQPATEATFEQIEQQYIPSNEDSKEVVNRLVPNLQQVSMQTLLLSQQQPDLLANMGEEEVTIASFAHDDDEYDMDKEAVSDLHTSSSTSSSSFKQRSKGSNSGIRYSTTTSPHMSRAMHSFQGWGSSSVPLPKKKSPISKFQQVSQQLDLEESTADGAPSMLFESDSILAIQQKYLHK